MDAMGHVNNTVYFRYCEQARMEWFSSLDLTASDNPSSQIVIINAFCEFLLPVVYPCTLLIEMSASSPGKTSFMSHYTISEQLSPEHQSGGQRGKIYSNAQAKIVWVNADGNKSVPMPDTVRAMFASGG